MEFEVLQRKELGPFHEDHLGVLARMFADRERINLFLYYLIYQGLVLFFLAHQ